MNRLGGLQSRALPTAIRSRQCGSRRRANSASSHGDLEPPRLEVDAVLRRPGVEALHADGRSRSRCRETCPVGRPRPATGDEPLPSARASPEWPDWARGLSPARYAGTTRSAIARCQPSSSISPRSSAASMAATWRQPRSLSPSSSSRERSSVRVAPRRAAARGHRGAPPLARARLRIARVPVDALRP